MRLLLRAAGLALLLSLLHGRRTLADEAPSAAVAPPAVATVVAPRPASKEPPRPPIFPVFGLGFSRLQGLNLQLGLGYEPGSRTGECRNGPLAVGHYGQGGHGAQAGYGWCMSPYGGLSARAAWLHTWGRPRHLETRQHYLGVEGRLMVVGFSGSIGVLRRVGPAAAGPDWAFNLGAGFGY